MKKPTKGELDRDIPKGGRVEAIPTSSELTPYLKKAIAASPSSLVFPDESGEMLPKHTAMEEVLRRAMRRAGIVTGYVVAPADAGRRPSGPADHAAPGPADHDRGLRPPRPGLPQEGDRPPALRAGAGRQDVAVIPISAAVTGSDPSGSDQRVHLSAGGASEPPLPADLRPVAAPFSTRFQPSPPIAHAPSTRRLGISKRRRGVKLSGREDLNLRPFGPEPGWRPSQAVRILRKLAR
jgi:hypothetical protein